MTYFSKRRAPLVYCGSPQDRPVLTVENRPKWCGLELVMPDGTVQEVGYGELQGVADARGTWPYVDHVPDPTVVSELAAKMGWHVDGVSYEVMVGRWETEVFHRYDR